MMLKLKLFTILFLLGCTLNGCKSKIEDSETYRQLLRSQEELERRMDSLKRKEFEMLDDSVMIELRSKTDSIRKTSDSLKNVIEEKIRKSKNKSR
ncbi:MAG: hypothetical protein N2510_10150 [Ignavibacteria bacterium]|nr:hypothetical protein [Ignavibacteria bacterium]